jgi:hypothetical protein
MMSKIIDIIIFLLIGKGRIAKLAVDNGIVSYEGQGRDKYGN